MDRNNKEPLKAGTLLRSQNREYTIREVLNIGNFGITYLATSIYSIGNVNFDIQFAIKEHFMNGSFRDKDGKTLLCRPDSKFQVEASRKDFILEGRLLQELCHKTQFIVKVNESFEVNGTAYYVMEYLNGGTLKSRTKVEAIQYLRNVMEAVQILHDRKILHLDIKPSNIILKIDEDTGEKYPVLVDMGNSIYFDANGKIISRPNSIGASKGYAPLEQYEKISTFSPHLDTYALGATLYALLTGKNPPNGTEVSNYTQILEKELEAASCSEFIPIIIQAMNPDPQKRFKKVDDLKNAFIFFEEKSRNGYANSHLNINSREETLISTTTVPVYDLLYYGRELAKNIEDPFIKKTLENLVIADNKYPYYNKGIVTLDNRIIVPFIYQNILPFAKSYFKGNDETQLHIIAKFEKSDIHGGGYGYLEITPNGDIIEKEFERDCQMTYPDETRTYSILHQFRVEKKGRKLTFSIAQIPGGAYGILDERGNVLAPFEYDQIDEFSDKCYIPGPGPCLMRFTGTQYRLGNYVGYFRITEEGVLIDAERYTLQEYNNRCIMT